MCNKIFLPILAVTMFNLPSSAQTAFYFGYENGFKGDNYHYVNDKGFSLNQFTPEFIWGLIAGCKVQNFTVETGYRTYNSTSPKTGYDYETGDPRELSGNGGHGSLSAYAIPLRFGYDFLHRNQEVFIRPETGINLLFTKLTGYSGSFSDNDFDSDNYTTGKCYTPSPFIFGIESSVSAGYRFRNMLDLYLKCGICCSFQPVYIETMVHHSETEDIAATQTYSGNSVTLQIGVKYYFKNHL